MVLTNVWRADDERVASACRKLPVTKLPVWGFPILNSKSFRGSRFEGHNPLCEALRGSLPLGGVLRGLCEGLFESSQRVLRGSTGFSEGSDRMLVTLQNCWINST